MRAAVRFAWAPATGPTAATYQLQLDDGCAGQPMAACAPAAPDLDLVVTGEAWQSATLPLRHPEDFRLDENFYVAPRRAE